MCSNGFITNDVALVSKLYAFLSFAIKMHDRKTDTCLTTSNNLIIVKGPTWVMVNML